MKKQTHHIQKQQVYLDFQTEEEARNWNKRFTDFYYKDILPQFSSLLDNAIPDNRSYIIDRLEIDLGSIHMGEFKESFLKKAETELKHMLNNRDVYISPTGVTGDAGPKKSPRQEHAAPIDRDQKEHSTFKKQLRIKDRKEHLLAGLDHFLDHGVLPWNSEFNTITELELAIRQDIEPEKLAGRPDFQKRMSMISIRRRFYFQFSKTFVEEVFDQIYSNELAILLSLKEDLEKQMNHLVKDDYFRKKIKRELSQSVWYWIIETGPADTKSWPQYFIRSVIEKLLPFVKPVEKTSIIKAILAELPSSSPLAVYLKKIRDIQSVISKDDGYEIDQDEATGDDMEPGENLHKEPSFDERARQRDDRDKDLRKEELSDTERSGSPDSEDVGSGLKSDSQKGESPEDSESGNDTLMGDDIKQKISDDSVSGESAHDASSSDEYTKQRHEGSKVQKKDEFSDTELSGKPDSEDDISRSESDTQKGELRDNIEPAQHKGKELYGNMQDFDDKTGRQSDHPEALEEYYLRNAGIILSWPYLRRLFDNLEYLVDKRFKEFHYQQRAVHLLGYIASGEDQCEEHELVLAKFLCAWPLQMPIIKELELMENEKSSADEMLSSLISHWSVLKNTSVEGLRESFFNREGKLFKEDEQWRLIVEQKSYDMLLDRLPYNISLIKLPWMGELLHVDWA